jgi:hypothetical protein
MPDSLRYIGPLSLAASIREDIHVVAKVNGIGVGISIWRR